jgi:hypothetical protein
MKLMELQKKWMWNWELMWEVDATKTSADDSEF